MACLRMAGLASSWGLIVLLFVCKLTISTAQTTNPTDYQFNASKYSITLNPPSPLKVSRLTIIYIVITVFDAVFNLLSLILTVTSLTDEENHCYLLTERVIFRWYPPSAPARDGYESKTVIYITILKIFRI